jgi:NAD-dependent deacetylase
VLRPDVVWFGEPLGEAFERAVGCASQSEVCLVVGTSAVVQPAAGVAMVTRRSGGVIIEVNPDATPLTPKSAVSLRATAADVVPRLLAPARG